MSGCQPAAAPIPQASSSEFVRWQASSLPAESAKLADIQFWLLQSNTPPDSRQVERRLCQASVYLKFGAWHKHR
jgi:hypothetical protein